MEIEMSKVEQVAMAMFAADGLKHAASNISLAQSWEMSPRYHADYLRRARAAIEAMGEPTPEMINVGISYSNWPHDGSHDDLMRTVFGAMVVVALKEKAPAG